MEKEEFLIALGKRIRKIREDKKMSITELGKKTGKEYRSIKRLENGEVNVSLVYLAEIAWGLKTDISTITTGLP